MTGRKASQPGQARSQLDGRTPPKRGSVDFPVVALGAPTTPRRPGFGELSQRALLDAYVPASVLINAKHEGLYHFGAIDRYLKVVPGEGTRDVLVMAREGLRAKMRSAIQRVKQGRARVTVAGAQLERDGRSIGVSITALPVAGDSEDLFLVSFVDDPTPEVGPVRPSESEADASRIAQLEQELAASREDLQSTVRDLEMANQEHRAINEEGMSVNEKLTALNGQLHETVEQQRSTSDDLQNILNSTDVATLFLDAELNIRFFTPAAKALFNVIASDVGRPLADLTRRFEDVDLLADARAVLASHAPIRREVKAADDSWFMRGMLPYRTKSGQVEGLVITFAGISEIKAAERANEVARAYLDSIIATIRQPLVVLDEELRVISASSSFHRVFSVEPEHLIGLPLLSAGAHLDVPVLREFLASIQARGTTISDHEIEIELPGVGRRAFSMSARVLREDPSAKRKILVAVVDVTEARREGKVLEAAKSEAERANVGKSRFLAAASHDLRQPLQTISLLQGMLEKRVRDKPTLELVHRLDETVGTMSSMLDKLLDINQLEAGIVRPEVVDFPIKRLLDEMRTEFTYLTRVRGPRLAGGPEQPHRAQRPPPARADHPQPAVERGEVHLQGQAPAGLSAIRRQPAHRGLGYRQGHPGTRASGHLRGVPSARQSGARTQQGPGPRSRHRAAPCRSARAQDRRSLRSRQRLGLHHRGAARAAGAG